MTDAPTLQPAVVCLCGSTRFNARILEQVIDLAEHLPYRPRRRLAFPPLHERVARHSKERGSERSG